MKIYIRTEVGLKSRFSKNKNYEQHENWFTSTYTSMMPSGMYDEHAGMDDKATIDAGKRPMTHART